MVGKFKLDKQMLKPSEDWKWNFKESLKCLVLETETTDIKTSLLKRNLTVEAFSDSEFTIEDAAVLHSFQEYLLPIKLEEESMDMIALNCTAAVRFFKPVLPKSWFFDYSQGESDGELPVGQVIKLKNELNTAQFMVVDSSEQASLVVMIDPLPFLLTSSKSMNTGEIIKVMNDRVQSIVTIEEQRDVHSHKIAS
ncbi:cell division protein ZapC [Vibrio sp.]|nr:cell division protein ZapC [Vibrio sp.]